MLLLTTVMVQENKKKAATKNGNQQQKKGNNAPSAKVAQSVGAAKAKRGANINQVYMVSRVFVVISIVAIFSSAEV